MADCDPDNHFYSLPLMIIGTIIIISINVTTLLHLLSLLLF